MKHLVMVTLLFVILCLLVALSIVPASKANTSLPSVPTITMLMEMDNVIVQSIVSATGEHLITITVRGREAREFLEQVGKRVIPFPQHGVVVILDPNLPI